MTDNSQSFDALNNWFSSANGHGVVAAIDEQLKPLLNQLRGEHLLQLGVDRHYWHYNLFRYQHIDVASPFKDSPFASVICELESMPLASESIDCVIAPFSFELCKDRQALMQEIDRILNPMGYLILLGVNPWGLWGYPARLFKRLDFIPSNGRLKQAFGIRKELVALGFNVQYVTSFYYLPPVKQQAMARKMSVFNQLGNMLWPIPASFYLMVAQKFQLNFINPEPLFKPEPVMVKQRQVIN